MANGTLGSNLNGNRAQSNGAGGLLPFRDVLLQHVQLSRQVSQALFASIQSSFSTALPPDPIPRPDRLSQELAQLPIWSLPVDSSPTSKELIPSLVAIHDSLDELLLKARTHRQHVRRIQALKEDTDRLQSIRRDRIRKLRDANVELREAVLGCNEEMSRVKRARRAPLNYADVLSYASDLARNTSAPPGWSGSNRLLQQQVGEALKTSGTPRADGVTEDKPSTDDQPLESKDTPMTSKSNARESTAGPDTPSGGNAAPTPANKPTEKDTNAVGAPKSAPFTNPEESGPSATSAPHILPFPSDADMRRGLLGVAMLEEQQQQGHPAEFKSVIPSWRQWLAGQEGTVVEAQTTTEHVQQAAATAAVVPRVMAPSTVKQEVPPDDEGDGGFGLDLN